MNETQWIFATIGSFLIGYLMAYFFKNIGKIYHRWGLVICYFLFPLIIVYLLLGAEFVMQMKSIFLSAVFAFGFFI